MVPADDADPTVAEQLAADIIGPEPEPHVSPQLAVGGSHDVDLEVCHACDGKSPPLRKNRRCKVYNWVGCENCPRWYHTVCVTAKRNSDFVCDLCA